MTVTLTLAILTLYTLYFMWLISTDEQSTRHAQELADLDPHKHITGMTVNEYFFADNHKDDWYAN